ncbi:hypothetical protein LSAT2_022581 [Lamellibrachia satsuma]|nr:hypothetical protein LSAT2_022581 [Lamellibrachia satsuma]
MDDFDSTTSSKTAMSQYTTVYSEDFESGSTETDTAQSRDISDVSQSVTSTRSETRSNVSKDQSERTDMTQNDVNDTDTEYSSDSAPLDLETQSTSQCSVSYTDSSKRSGSTSKQSSDQQTDASDVTDSKRGTATKCTEESGGTPRAVSHTYSSASEAKYSYDDDFTQHESSEEEEEEDREEREAAHKAELTYIERKLQALKSGPACRSIPEPHLRLQPSKRGIKNTQHLEDFCCRKLALLKKKRHSPALIGSTLDENEVVRHQESARCMYLGLEGSQRVDTHGMSSIKVRKLRERHSMEQIRKAAQTKVHIPRKCPACREKMAELAEEEFFRAKTAKMLARLLEQKYEKHLLKYSDTVGLIGELVHELPTMQQSPSDITRQLLQPLEYRPRVGTEESPSYHLKETNRLQPDVLQDTADVWEAYMAPLHNSNWMPAKS